MRASPRRPGARRAALPGRSRGPARAEGLSRNRRATAPPITLAPMSLGEYDSFRSREIPRYAEAHVRAGNWTAAEALDRAKEEFDRLLPRGLKTPEQFFRVIRAREGTIRVGELWYALREGPGGREAFIYWIGIDPEHRRSGYAQAALGALAIEATGRGASRLSLHVFGDNPGAIALYEKLGFHATDLLMSRPLGREPLPSE